MISIGQGKYKVWLKEERLDDGIVFIIGGGELSHIGSIVLSEPRMSRTGKGFSCTSQIINVHGHKDEKIARTFAERICVKRKKPVLCICGIHIDDATKKDIKIIEENAKKLLKKILEE
jgi:hypothetical protein